MADETPVIELNAHDMTRVWSLAIAIYDGDDEDADLRDYFVQAMQIYMEFVNDLAAGGTTFEDANHEFVSEREVTPQGDVVRFRGKKLESKKGGPIPGLKTKKS